MFYLNQTKNSAVVGKLRANGTNSANKNRGFSLAESLVYMALLVFLLVGIINAIVMLTSMYRNVRTARAIESSAISLMDRIVREVRNADSVNSAQTSWNISSGSLGLNSTDQSGTPTTIRFYIATSTSRAMIEENGASLGPITDGNVIVTNLIFRSYATTTSSAVKIEMTITSASTSPIFISRNFYGTAVLRGSYQ